MIIAVPPKQQKEFTVGMKALGYISDANGDYHTVEFLVMREATKEEYCKYVDEERAECENWDEIHDPGMKFYLISTD